MSFLDRKKIRNYSYGLGVVEFGIMRDGKLLILPCFFCHFASQVTKSSSADAVGSLRHVTIGNDPLVSKVAAAAELFFLVVDCDLFQDKFVN